MILIDPKKIPVLSKDGTSPFITDCHVAIAQEIIDELVRSCSIDAEPIHYSRWLIDNRNPKYVCERCRSRWFVKLKYCGHCGAKMREVAECDQ